MVFQNTYTKCMVWSGVPNSILLSAFQKLQYDLVKSENEKEKKKSDLEIRTKYREREKTRGVFFFFFF